MGPSIYVCSNCHNPSYFDQTVQLQIPGQAQGDEVKHLPVDLGKLYDEARYCVSVNSFTASILVCRKILLHLAVNKGAPTGQKFEEAVDYLVSKGYVPPDGKEWVDTIRKKGNEANHEIKLMNKTDAVELISFIEMLLKFMYEFPAKVKKSP